MRFWDASALIALLVDEPAREATFSHLEEDPEVLVWWGTPVEMMSALARREREGGLAERDVLAAQSAIGQLARVWHEILPTEMVRRTAQRLLRMHPLRAADSLQLAAALVACGHDASSLEMVCLDDRLTVAARREGFPVIAA